MVPAVSGVHQPRPFVEGTERQLLDERYPANKYVVHFGSELHTLDLLAPHYRSQVRLVDAHYPVRNALSVVSALEVKYDLRPSLGRRLFLVSPKFSAISQRGSNFFILPNSLVSNVER